MRLRVGVSADARERAAPPPTLWAVVVGVSRYQFGGQEIEGSFISNLKYAAEDAQAFGNFLRSDEGGGFRDVSEGGRLIMLKDEQATRAGIEQALGALKQAKPEDYFVVYIAAHGVLVPQTDPKTNASEEVPYFFLHDTDPRNPETIGQTALRMERVQQLIREIPARKGLVLSDTCHSAGVDMAGRGVRLSASRANEQHLEQMRRIPEGVGFIAAARQTQSSLERDELRHGVFTWSLLEGLRGHADGNQDGVVIFDELASYLSREVPRLTNNQQHPHVNTTRIGANLIALSVVRYTESVCDTQPCGALVVRAPDLNEVMVSVDDAPPTPLSAHAERTWRLRSGDHRLVFLHGGQREVMKATVEPGRSLFFEVNLSFSQGADNELVEAAPAQVIVSMRDEQAPRPEARELLIKGVMSFDRQNFEEAIELLNQAVAANGGAYADAFVYRGRAEQSLGRKREAVETFRQAVALRPTDYETRTLLAEARFQAGDNLDAVARELQAIIARHPNDDFARLVLGDLLFLRGDLVGAELQLRRAIRNRPLSPPAHLILADVLMVTGGREAEAARLRSRPANQPNAKLTEAIAEAEKALSYFQQLSQKRVAAASTPNRLALSHVVLSGARYSNTAALAEAHHVAARALIQAVEHDDTQAANTASLQRARERIKKADEYARQLRDPLRLALVTETSAHLWLMQEDVARAISEAQQALATGAQVAGLKDFYDPHYTLYSAYATSQDHARAADHLQIYLNGYRHKMKPEQRQAMEDELAMLRRNARLQTPSGDGGKSKGKRKKHDGKNQ
jgi:uncharacterized caspase-like protein/tetratricopeptide (TPR) repeat protein